MLVTMIWIRDKNEWHMMDDVGIFIQEFYNCGNIHNFFPDLNKNEANMYRVDIEKIN